MTDITHDRHTDSHWTPMGVCFSALLGVVATAGLWLGSGLLLMLFLL